MICNVTACETPNQLWEVHLALTRSSYRFTLKVFFLFIYFFVRGYGGVKVTVDSVGGGGGAGALLLWVARTNRTMEKKNSSQYIFF